MRRLIATLDRAPLYWLAVALGLLIFSGNRLRIPASDLPSFSEQENLDLAFMERMRSGEWAYELLPDSPQTFGGHVLPQILRTGVSLVTGDVHRAGIWLSLCGVVGVLTGLYILAIRIFPLRGFALATVVAAGALPSLHASVKTDPSAALGMALVVWGMAFFLTALTERKPNDIFASGLMFGLAGYIRIELSLIWVFLALYLVLLQILHGKARKHETSALSMALGGLVTVLLVLWPLLHRNVQLSGTPVLPGYDADLILGAPALAGSSLSTGILERLGQGLSLLTVSDTGPGIFAGLLWPLGMALCLVIGRHEKLPFFWIPVLLGTLLGMTALSLVTGRESYGQTLIILTPMVFPFALLPLAYVTEQVLEHTRQPADRCRWIWAGVAVVFLLLLQFPLLFRSFTPDPSTEEALLVEDVESLPAMLRNATWVSDQPGPLVRAGKRNVIGTRGQTDWTILTSATAYGSFRHGDLLEYLEAREVEVLHLADLENPLVDRLRLEQGAPGFEAVSSVRPPHRVFVISWP